MRDRAQKRIPDILGLGFQMLLVCLLGQHDPFHGHGGLIHKAFKKMDVFGIEILFRVSREDTNNPTTPEEATIGR